MKGEAHNTEATTGRAAGTATRAAGTTAAAASAAVIAAILTGASAVGCGTTGDPAWDGPGPETNLNRPVGVKPPDNRRGGLFGYSVGPLYRRDIRTVAVEMFGSRDFRRNYEFKLTEAVAKRVELETGYKLAPANRADTLLTGELQATSASTLSETPQVGSVREQEASLYVRWTWKDLRTGRILAQIDDEFAYANIYPLFNQGLSLGYDMAIDGIARRITAKMREDF
jgi:hypothetical protein